MAKTYQANSAPTAEGQRKSALPCVYLDARLLCSAPNYAAVLSSYVNLQMETILINYSSEFLCFAFANTAQVLGGLIFQQQMKQIKLPRILQIFTYLHEDIRCFEL